MDRILILSILIPATFSYIDPGVKLVIGTRQFCVKIFRNEQSIRAVILIDVGFACRREKIFRNFPPGDFSLNCNLHRPQAGPQIQFPLTFVLFEIIFVLLFSFLVQLFDYFFHSAIVRLLISPLRWKNFSEKIFLFINFSNTTSIDV